ncbi:MAG TPA: ATP-dependent helicase HrpB [Sulfurospirillum arcachonense]|nr:ATP-dependent helicase HrpB [Sulfurospirillum arcachonense]HIP45793.1 ATP-dependent helicase HrpB [Sulfurospirillum arcachonense]
MKNLPINEVIPEIKSKLYKHTKLILQAPPGAGKSTVVPISFLDEPWLKDKIIIMLEPRRVAARMVATRMAQSLGEEVGQRVGYQVKMDSKHSKQTKILVVTEAILVRKLQSNPDLEEVAMIIFDEFHERSIHTDLSLALSLQVQELLRDDLKILIMSATLDSSALTAFLTDTPVVTSFGKSYEVKYSYLETHISQPNYRTINNLLLSCTLKAFKEDDGDILVFLAGVKEIKTLEKGLKEKLNKSEVQILPLYSALSKVEQDKAINRANKRKIILSTNIAQTSLTIEGVKIVIDSGFEKLSRYNYATGMNHLELSFISSDSATQRAGRAGRISHGKCYRLWHENKILQKTTKPEILRSDLSSVVLDLALWGVEEFGELHWLDIPDETVVKSTKEVLYELNMLDSSYKITQFGKKALSLGVHPRFAYMILKADEFGFAYEATLLAALLSEKDIFKSSYRDSDIKSRFTYLYEKDFDSIYINQYSAKEVHVQSQLFYKKLKSIKNITKSTIKFHFDMVAIMLLWAYPDRLAKRRVEDDVRYKLSNGKGASLRSEDSLFNEEFLVVPSLHVKNIDSYINLACSINIQSIEEYFSSLITKKESVTYNKQTKKFDIREENWFLNLQLSSKPSKNINKKDFKELFLNLLKEKGIEFLPWSKKASNLKNRVNFVRKHMQIDIKDFSDKNLLETLEFWLAPFIESINSIKEVENLDMYSILVSMIPWEKQKELNKLAPTSIKVPSGSNILIDYFNKDKPSLHVKIQEVFGLNETPKILNNSFALQLHLLSPAKRPIQITYDLKSFWENSYDEVRKELRGKYKKHYWPQNPYNAIATKKTKKYM